MEELIGKQFGPYRIVEKLGEGGMAVVYKAYQESLGRYAAIKVLRAELARDEEFVNRFRREALAVANLHHPNILTVYDAGAAHGVYYIVMGLIDGGSLKDLLLRGPMDPHHAASVASQLADALDYAHRQGVIHRDVKPSNVLMTTDGRPMLTDFGIAKAMYESSALTRTGVTIGTPEYMAPEQIQGQPVDGRADIYALGIVLYEMLSGWAPFSAPTPVATLYKQVNESPPPIHQVNMNVPEWLEGVVNRALAKRPETRYQHASEFAEALRQGPPVRAADAAIVAARPAPEAPAGSPRGPVTPPGGRGSQPTPRPDRGPAATPAPGRSATPVPALSASAVSAVPGPTPATPPRAKRKLAVPLLVGAIVILALALLGAAAALLLGGGGAKGAIGPEPGTPTATAAPAQIVTKVVTAPPREVVTLVVTSPPKDVVTMVVTNPPAGAVTMVVTSPPVGANRGAGTAGKLHAAILQTPGAAPAQGTRTPRVTVPSATPVPAAIAPAGAASSTTIRPAAGPPAQGDTAPSTLPVWE
jgi:serine/threonine-protein kinase